MERRTCVAFAVGVVLVALGFSGLSPGAEASQVPLTILHTNDVHSHYQADKGPMGLGGIGRLATEIRRQRAQAQNSLLLDGGDWSEGNIYYNLDAGRTSLEIMNELGYDAAVIGNHDWLSGPDQMLKLFTQVKPTFPILGANLDLAKYPRAAEFSKYVTPYQILNVGGIKVAVVGIVTYELIYDRYFAPVDIKD
ncbi:MAG: metallophosphoesterase, partial [Deltaproteobacteria bacterium]|nr:metallophosphoesterase [Deltaproteobacteria bacterium]